jgi:GNAT superfamily N-acetyltransferase
MPLCIKLKQMDAIKPLNLTTTYWQVYMKVRKAKLDDIEQLVTLLVQLFQQEHDFVVDEAAHHQGLAAIINQPEIGEIFVVEQDNQLIAMVNLLYSISTALGGKVAIIEDMVVKTGYQGQQIGSQLLASVIDYAKSQQCLRLTLLTDHDNHTAHHFYKKQGFEPSSMHVFRLSL